MLLCRQSLSNRLLRLCLALCLAMSAYTPASAVMDAASFYSRLKSVDNDRIMAMGERYDLADKPDSALVCYTVVVDHLSDTDLSADDMRLYARALNNLAFVYGSYYSDYQKAFGLLQKSIDISLESGYISNVAYNYLNMGGLYLVCHEIYGKQLFADEIWSCSEKGIDAALSTGEWEVALACMANIGAIYNDAPRPEKLRELTARINKAPITEKAVPTLKYYRSFLAGFNAAVDKKYDYAAKCFRDMEHLIPPGTMGAPRYRIIALSALANTYLAMGDTASALAATERYLEIARSEGVADEETKSSPPAL